MALRDRRRLTNRATALYLSAGDQAEGRTRPMSDMTETGSSDTSAPSLRQPSSPGSIRVLIVDDHAVVRQGLRTFIDLQDDMEVVGEAANGAEAVELARRLQPDIEL